MMCPFNNEDGVCHPRYCAIALQDGDSSDYYCSFAVLAQCAAEQSSDEAMGELSMFAPGDPDADQDGD